MSIRSTKAATARQPYTRYLEAAWLFSNILDAQAKNPADISTMIVLQVAAWDLFVEPGAKKTALERSITVSGETFHTAVVKALVDAQTAVVSNNWGAANAGNWSLVTGDPDWVRDSHGNIPVQEFLTPIHTPEPSALILLATMVGILGTAIRRRIGTR